MYYIPRISQGVLVARSQLIRTCRVIRARFFLAFIIACWWLAPLVRFLKVFCETIFRLLFPLSFSVVPVVRSLTFWAVHGTTHPTVVSLQHLLYFRVRAAFAVVAILPSYVFPFFFTRAPHRPLRLSSLALLWAFLLVLVVAGKGFWIFFGRSLFYCLSNNYFVGRTADILCHRYTGMTPVYGPLLSLNYPLLSSIELCPFSIFS